MIGAPLPRTVARRRRPPGEAGPVGTTCRNKGANDRSGPPEALSRTYTLIVTDTSPLIRLPSRGDPASGQQAEQARSSNGSTRISTRCTSRRRKVGSISSAGWRNPIHIQQRSKVVGTSMIGKARHGAGPHMLSWSLSVANDQVHMACFE
jgi:hypothetical protein